MGAKTTVTRKGQVTIPIDIRRSLGIGEGDQVEWSQQEGQARLMKTLSPESDLLTHLPIDSVVRRTAGVFAKYAQGRAVTIEEMKAAISQGWAESDWSNHPHHVEPGTEQ